VKIMYAEVKSVFVRDPVEPVYLEQTKEDAPVLDYYRFHLSRNIQAQFEMSMEPQDGNKYTLLIGCFIDGVEACYVTDWITNSDAIRAKDYKFDIARYAKFMTPKKAHSVQIKLGQRKTLQWFRAREYDLFESDVYYYKVQPNPNPNE